MSPTTRMARGATLMVLFKLIERSLGFISTLILARLLVPGDFGLVAMGTSFIALIELIGAFGFDISLIRLAKAERVHYDTAWTLNVGVGTLLAVLMLATAFPLATFYDEPRLPQVIFVLALGSIATSLENIGVVEFRRQLEFGREFRFQVAKKVAGVRRHGAARLLAAQSLGAGGRDADGAHRLHRVELCGSSVPAPLRTRRCARAHRVLEVAPA